MTQLLEKPESLVIVIAETPAEITARFDAPAYGEGISTNSIDEKVQQLATPVETSPALPTESRIALGQTALGLANKAAFTATRWRQEFYSLGDRVTRIIEGTSKKPNIARIAASRLVALSVILVAAGAVVKPAGEHLDSVHFHYDSLPDGLDIPDVSHTLSDHVPIEHQDVDTTDTTDFSLRSAHSNTIEIHDVSVQAGEGSEHWFDKAGFTHKQAHELAYSTSDDAMDTKEDMVKDGSAYWADEKHGVIGMMGDVKDVDSIQKYADSLTSPDANAPSVDADPTPDVPAHADNDPATPTHPPKVHITELEPFEVPEADSSPTPNPTASPDLLQATQNFIHNPQGEYLQWPLEAKISLPGFAALSLPFLLKGSVTRMRAKSTKVKNAERQAEADVLNLQWLADPESYRQEQFNQAKKAFTILRKELKGTDKKYYKKYAQIHTEIINRLKTEAFPFLDGNGLEQEVANIARQLTEAMRVEEFHTDDGRVNMESFRDTRPIIDRILKGELPAQKEYVERARDFSTTP